MAPPAIKILKSLWPILTLIFIWLIFTWQFWLKGLIPAPLDFLVGFYAPWQAGQVPIKNPAIPDVVNQIIPWKLFTIDTWKSGQVPLWNPYNFSGTPHAANWQSAVFYPLQFIFWLTDFQTAWSIFVLLQPLLAGLFTYLFVKSLKRSSLASLLAALAFMFSGFMTTWLEWGTLGHAFLWLPLALWFIEKFHQTKLSIFYLLLLTSLSFSLLAGHLQISLYVITLSSVYFLYRSHAPRKSLLTLGLLVFPFLLTGFQLLPSLELYFHSFRSQAIPTGWFQSFEIPLSGLITFLAPDFFGHPITRNSFTHYSYVEMSGYIGLIPLILALLTLRSKYRFAPVKFFWWTILISLVLSLKTPLANIALWLHLPIFSSSSPARIISLISFSLAVLSAFGLDHLIQDKKIPSKFLLTLAGIFTTLWLATFILHLPVSRHNLILPTIIFIAFGLIVNLRHKLPLFLILSSLFLITLLDLYRFHAKFTPYADRKYWYPQMKFIAFLKQHQGIDRNFGIFDGQLNLPFQLYSTDGYDTLFPANYGKFLKLDTTDRVSSASLSKSSPQTMDLINSLGVKYVIQGVVHGAAPWELQLWNYPDQFNRAYEDERYQVFQNLEAKPRAYLTNNHGNVEVKSSTPNTINLAIDSPASDTLILSDNYYPGWQAAVDSRPVTIERIQESFRSVSVPAGKHLVNFTYHPLSFIIGLWIAGLSLTLLVIVTIIRPKRA